MIETKGDTPRHRAEEHARLVGLPNVEFRQGAMEEIPLGDETVDVIISNGVISMSPRKHQVFREAWRVLKSGRWERRPGSSSWSWTPPPTNSLRSRTS